MLLVTKACRACQREFDGGELFCPVDGTRLSTRSRIEGRGPADALVGVTLDGRYRVQRLIGEGGMGFVYEAQHVALDKRVAVKVLRDDFSRRPDVVERFHQEARSATRIGHPNIVDVSDFGETPGGASYFVMELLDGEDLADRLGRKGMLLPRFAAHVARECCGALAAAHGKGIIHRDLKPENVFLVRREGALDQVKIVDFGVAKMTDEGARSGSGRKLTRTGMVFGTPEYMSPEQASGEQPDHRVDVYALGIITYEMITGRVPFEGDNFMQVLKRHASERVPPMRELNPRCVPSPSLEAVVMRALEKAPGDRFESMEEMATALTGTDELSAGSAPPPLVAPPPVRTPLPPMAVVDAPPGPAASAAFAAAEPETRELPAPVEAELEPPAGVPQRRPTRAAWGLGPLVLLVFAVGWWTTRAAPPPGADVDSAEPPPSAEAAPEPSAAVATAVGDEVAAAAPAAAEPGAQAEPEQGAGAPVTIRVSTEPPGARLAVAGMGEVCASTPCEFDTYGLGELTLSARRGRARAAARIDARQASEVHMVLEAPREAPPPKPRSRVTASAAPDDLKVPAIFRDRTR